MTAHIEQQLLLEELGMTLEEFQELIDNTETNAGLPGFEVNNVPQLQVLDEFTFNSDEYIYDVPAPEPMIVGGFGVENVDTVKEYEAFGVKLNDADDIISVSIVLLVVGLIYIGKSSIDYWFAARLERFKKRIEKE